jgi:hypothetical protein
LKEIYCLNTEFGLKPIYGSDYEEKKKLKIGEVYCCKIENARNYEFLKKFFALLELGHQNTKEFKEDIPSKVYRKWAIIKAGYFDIYHTSKGVMVEAKSISFVNMDEEEFQKVYNGVLDVIIKDIGVDRNIIEKELVNFL